MATNLFTPIRLGGLELPNRIVMAPLTRNRAGQPGNVPQSINVTYYAQRASAGLIITEASPISDMAHGYPGTPGIHSPAQVAGWKRVTDTVHAKGGRIFLQLWHVGRISHPSLLPNDALPVAPSAIKPAGQAFTHQGMVDFVTPRALETSEIPALIENYRIAAHEAKAAGFDGVELHGANGYLLDQFLRDGSNHRTDQYGGSIANRTRLLQEVVAAVCEVWGAARVGVRISPLNQFNDMRDSNPQELFNHVADTLRPFGLAYLHVAEVGEDGGRCPSTSPSCAVVSTGITWRTAATTSSAPTRRSRPIAPIPSPSACRTSPTPTWSNATPRMRRSTSLTTARSTAVANRATRTIRPYPACRDSDE